ncbi:SpoIID/LytB domain-containing protein [Kribbella deserti]|uniref:SpoIID/LytB domain-containing protein n=1 Tax=Kribbella deserti TaxID=1926257 RepID=A0ABV6QRV5_9ACTN
MSGSVALLLATTLVMPAAPVATPAAPASLAAGDLVIQGRGYGHGRGMSQYGAQGAALAGKSSTEIMNFYYPGTTRAQAGGTIRIHLTADTTDGLRVVAVNGLRARDLGDGTVWTLPRSSNITSWSIDPYGTSQTRLRYYWAPTRQWVVWNGRSIFKGMAQFEGPAVTALVLPSGRQVGYRGALRTADRNGSSLDTINVVPLESYLRGVVPREAITSWRREALQAQAVAARTYSAYHRRLRATRDYDLCDTVSCQVYGGYGAEVASTDAAIADTAGVIRVRNGVPVIAEFSASSGGQTAPGDQPYQVGKADPYDGHAGNPHNRWQVTVERATAERVFGVGTLRSIVVSSRNGYGEWGGRALRVQVTGSAGTRTFTGEQVRYRLRLRSSWFNFG